MSTRQIRKAPFCWQEKDILRLLRKIYSGNELSKYRNLYLTLTEMDSDFNGKDIKYYTKTIATYSGLSKEWIPKALKKLEDLGIIRVVEERKSGKFKGKSVVFTGETPPPTVSGKPVNGKTDTSEHNTLLEDNKESLEKQSFSDNGPSFIKSREAKPNSLPVEPPFSSAEYIADMIANGKSPHIRLIGTFFREKKMFFPTKVEIEKDIRRWSADASFVSKYPDVYIARTFNYVKKEFPECWNLSTMRKYIAQARILK